MNDSKQNVKKDEELIGVLAAISVVSKRLARKLIRLNQNVKSKEAEKDVRD